MPHTKGFRTSAAEMAGTESEINSMRIFAFTGMPPASLKGAMQERCTLLEAMAAWQRGENFPNRKVARSKSGVVGGTGTKAPTQATPKQSHANPRIM